MNYTDIINRAFRTLKSGGIWGFVITVQLALLALFAAGLGIGLAASGGIGGVTRMFDTLQLRAVPTAADFQPLFIIYGSIIVASIVSIPLSLISYGGTIRLTDDAQAGRTVTVGGGWAAGARMMGRVFLVELIFALIGTAMLLIGFVPIILGAVAASRGGANPSGGAVVGICGGLLLLVLAVLALILMSGFESLAVRYAVVGDRSAGDAVGAGWAAFRARFGSVLLFMLILFGFGFAIYLVQTALNYAVEFATLGPAAVLSGAMSPGSFSEVARLIPTFGLLMLVSLTLSILSRVFQMAMWTAFFRQLTGLQPAPQPAAYPQNPYGAGYAGPVGPQGYQGPPGYPMMPPPPAPPMGTASAPQGWMPPTPPQPPAGYAPSQPPQGDGQSFAAYPGPYPQPSAVAPRSPYDPYNRTAEHSVANDPYTTPAETRSANDPYSAPPADLPVQPAADDAPPAEPPPDAPGVG